MLISYSAIKLTIFLNICLAKVFIFYLSRPNLYHVSLQSSLSVQEEKVDRKGLG